MIKEYAYQRASLKQLHDCARWTLNTLQMRDWQIDVYDNGKHDDCYGNAEYDIYTLKGIIWVNKELCRKKNKNPYSTAIHEILHIFVGYKMGEEDPKDEMLTRAIEPILYREFCRMNKRKEAKEIE